MEELKIINREIKIFKTIKYNDGTMKTIEDHKAYYDDTDLPVFVCIKCEYRDSKGNIDKDKSYFFSETLCYSSDDETSQEEHTDTDSESDSDSESESESSQC